MRCRARPPPAALPLLLLLLAWPSPARQESADLTPFHGFLPQRRLRALLPPGDPHPNDIYHRSRPEPDPIPAGFEIKYPDYKFTFDIPKDPERPVYIIREKSTEPVVKGHHACDGHGHGATSIPANVAPPVQATVAPPQQIRPTAAAPLQVAPQRPPFARPPVQQVTSSPFSRPETSPSFSRPVTSPSFSHARRQPVQLTSSATLSRPTPTVFSKPHRPFSSPPPLLTRSREPAPVPRPAPRPAPRPTVSKPRPPPPPPPRPTPPPSSFARMKDFKEKLRKYPAEQYRVFPGGYARLSTYSSLSG